MQRFGFEIGTYRPVAPRRQQILTARGIDLVLDVGAHHGDYVTELRGAGYTGSVISFEPGQAQFAVLGQTAANDPRWAIHKVALSDENGEAQLSVGDLFSSLLKSNDGLTSIWPEATSKEIELVTTARLDDFDNVASRCKASKPLLKLDVQGHEMGVLAGATQTLAEVDVIEVELTITELYDRQPLIVEILRYLDDRGFALVSLDPVSRDYQTGHYYQFDGILVR